MSEKDTVDKIGQFVAKTRKVKGLSQAALAKLSNTSGIMIRRLETGKAAGIGFESLLSIARALEMPFSDMMHAVEKGENEAAKMNTRWEYLLERINRFNPTQKEWVAKILEDILERP